MSAVTILANNGWGHHDMDWGAGWWVLMALGMVLFWGLLILGAVWLVRELLRHRGGHPGGGSDALQMLDRRLAEGEISVEDYRERRAILTGSSPPRGGDHPPG